MKLRHTASLRLLALLLVTFITGVRSEEEVEVAEELPNPEAYRQGRPGPGQRYGNPGYRDSSRWGSEPRPSYDMNDVFQALQKSRNSNRRGSSSGSGSGSSDSGFNSKSGYNSKLDYNYESDFSSGRRKDEFYTSPYDSTSFGSLGAASEYGGYASESGYGLTCASGYVNASAVALLAFLFLLNIVQDVIQQITAGGARRKRDDSSSSSSSELLQFLSDGGVDALYEHVPHTVLSLMIDLLDAWDADHPEQCTDMILCEANNDLTTKFGSAGRILGALVSNVAATAFGGSDPRRFNDSLKAARLGRRDNFDCQAAFPRCRSIKYSQNGHSRTDQSQNSSVYEKEGIVAEEEEMLFNSLDPSVMTTSTTRH
ncbi:uncharacterized protein LOC143020391 isoform X2 [Oratosquilla oratoria]|uniref:uncharacterized protein LOC143020391 isoform X2 n=1 Tax=Oratosquilla oratoria TaxID=337810 RepID=UPI003F758206